MVERRPQLHYSIVCQRVRMIVLHLCDIEISKSAIENVRNRTQRLPNIAQAIDLQSVLDSLLYSGTWSAMLRCSRCDVAKTSGFMEL